MNNYGFQIATGFYDQLHEKLKHVRIRENDSHRRQGGLFGRNLPSLGFKSIPDLYGPEVIPSRQHLAEIVDTAFWASLGKEEGRAIRFKINYKVDRAVYFDEIAFTHPLEYTPSSIVKLALSCGNHGSLLLGPSLS